MPIKLQIRRGTASNWSTTSPDPVLLAGEIGYETDTGNFKVGDGTTAWASLPYALPHKTGTVAAAVSSIISIDQANARVGIGTTTPLSQLHVESAAPIVRLRDSGALAGVYSAIDGDNTDGSLTITADVGNAANNSSVSIATDSTIRTTFTQDGSNNTRVGIGVVSPSTALHVNTAAPALRLSDAAATTVYAELSQVNASGSLNVAADEGNAIAGSTINLRTDGTTRVAITDSAVTVTPVLTPNGGVTANTVALTALANQTGPIVVGRQTASSGSVSALSVATLQTMLGLGADSYLNFFTARNLLSSDPTTGTRWYLNSVTGSDGNPALSSSGSYGVQYTYGLPISLLTIGKITRCEYSANVARGTSNFPTTYFRLAVRGTGVETFIVLDHNLNDGSYIGVQSWFGSQQVFADRYQVLTATAAGTSIIDYGANPTGNRYAYIMRLS